MTTNTTHQPMLTDDEIRVVIHNAIGFAFDPNELQQVNGADLMNVAYDLLSKLRAPVAGSVVPPMPPTKDRGPSDFEGYTESDFDWNRSNPGALTWLADNHAAIRAALASSSVAGEADEEDATAAWRRLALQFDDHRMQALGHLRAMLADPQAHADRATVFLAAPPLSGEQVLAERIRALAAPQASEAVRDTEAGDVPGAWRAQISERGATWTVWRWRLDSDFLCGREYLRPTGDISDRPTRYRSMAHAHAAIDRAALSAQPGAQKEQSDA